MSAILTVAPREIGDLVYRCCRVAGADPGLAELIAHNVKFAEVHLGGAVAAVAPILDQGEMGHLLSAHRDLAAAEVAARSTERRAEARFDPPVPLAVVAASMWGMAGRGALASGDFQPTDAGVPVDAISVRSGEVGEQAHTTIVERWRTAYRDGLVVDRGWFNQLERRASVFLVAESTLDDLD